MTTKFCRQHSSPHFKDGILPDCFLVAHRPAAPQLDGLKDCTTIQQQQDSGREFGKGVGKFRETIQDKHFFLMALKAIPFDPGN
jgi:hypothetical protein